MYGVSKFFNNSHKLKPSTSTAFTTSFTSSSSKILDLRKSDIHYQGVTRRPGTESADNPKMGNRYPHKEIHKVTCDKEFCEYIVCPTLCGEEESRLSIGHLTSATMVPANESSRKTSKELHPNQNFVGQNKAQNANFYNEAQKTEPSEVILHDKSTTFLNMPEVRSKVIEEASKPHEKKPQRK